MPGQILPRLFWPALFVSLLFGLTAWAQPLLFAQRFTVHWFRNGTVLRAVHCLVLGQLGLLFLSVLVQALPVLFRLTHSHPRISAWAQSLWALGALGLVAFVGGWRSAALLLAALAALLTAWTLLGAQALGMAATSQSRTFAWKGLGQAFFYLGCMLVLGAAMAGGLLTPLLPQAPLQTLQLHLHLGLWGFVGLAIFGFLPKLLRLFQSSTGYPAWPLTACFAAVHAGLVLLFLHWLGLGPAALAPLAGLCLLAAALLFSTQITLLLQAAKARRLDSSLGLQVAGLLFLLPAAALDTWLLAGHGSWQQSAAALALALGGFLSLVLLGTLQRICAVLAWFQRFFAAAMTHAVPTAWDLISPRVAWSILPLQAGAALALAGGLWTGQTAVIRLSGALGCGAQLGTFVLAWGALRHGQAVPFPDGEDPYAEWVRAQA